MSVIVKLITSLSSIYFQTSYVKKKIHMYYATLFIIVRLIRRNHLILVLVLIRHVPIISYTIWQ